MTIGDSMAAVTSEQCFVERFTVTCNKPVSHLQLSCCLSHCAVPWEDKNIRIYENNNLEVFLHLFSMNTTMSYRPGFTDKALIKPGVGLSSIRTFKGLVK